MATYKWSVPTGKEINGQTYIKDTDNKIADTISDLVDFVNGEGAHAGQGIMYDFVDKASIQTITGVKTFSNGINANVTGTVTGNASSATTLATSRIISLAGDVPGTVSFNGSSDVNMTTTVIDDSHTHDTRYYTESEIDTKVTTLQNNIDLKASIANPTFTGAVTLPAGTVATTQTNGDNSTKLATTAYVDGNIGINNASLSTGGIGSYAFLIGTSLNGTFTAGNTYAGSGLKYTGINGESTATGSPYSGGAGASVTGTWKAMGSCLARVDRYPSTIFLRIA